MEQLVQVLTSILAPYISPLASQGDFVRMIKSVKRLASRASWLDLDIDMPNSPESPMARPNESTCHITQTLLQFTSVRNEESKMFYMNRRGSLFAVQV